MAHPFAAAPASPSSLKAYELSSFISCHSAVKHKKGTTSYTDSTADIRSNTIFGKAQALIWDESYTQVYQSVFRCQQCLTELLAQLYRSEREAQLYQTQVRVPPPQADLRTRLSYADREIRGEVQIQHLQAQCALVQYWLYFVEQYQAEVYQLALQIQPHQAELHTQPQDQLGNRSSTQMGSPGPRLTEKERRQNHIRSENKRREAIRAQYEILANIVPGMQGSSRSEAPLLNATASHIRDLILERESLIAQGKARGINTEGWELPEDIVEEAKRQEANKGKDEESQKMKGETE